MADIGGVNNGNNPFLNLNPEKDKKTDESESQSDMFMQLMIANLKNQDPTSPAKTNEFMNQISNMSMVEGVANLNSSMESFSNAMLSSQAALQASSLVGQRVHVPASSANLQTGEVLDGVLELPTSSPDVRISIQDGTGAEVGTLSLGAQAAGDVPFNWQLPEGLAPGSYRFEATALNTEGEFAPVQTFLGRNVESVTLGQNGLGMRINIPGGSVSLDEIKQIG